MSRVLVIDDCEELTDIVLELLENEGYAVERAHDRQSALARLEGENFDLILCDLVLPLDDSQSEESDSAMVGVHCIHEIAQKYPRVPIIAISGELVGSPLSAVEQFGACGTLSKPFGRKELLQAVQSALNTH